MTVELCHEHSSLSYCLTWHFPDFPQIFYFFNPDLLDLEIVVPQSAHFKFCTQGFAIVVAPEGSECIVLYNCYLAPTVVLFVSLIKNYRESEMET